MDTSVDLSVVVVSYNVKDLLRDCLESVYAQTRGISFEILVVDNASTDGSAEMVEEMFPLANLMRNEENLGFAKANNIAIRQSRARYVLLLNPDTVVLDGALQSMVAFMGEHPDAGAVGPKVLNPDGSIQHMHQSEEAYSYSYLFWWSVSLFTNTRYVRERMGEFSVARRYGKASRIGFLSGACFMLSRKAASDHQNVLDEGFFMFGEDRDLSLRIRESGYNIYLLPEASIIHYGGRSFPQGCTHARVLFFQSRFAFYRKHYGLARALVFRILAIVNSLVGLLALARRKALASSPSSEEGLLLGNELRQVAMAIAWAFLPCVFTRLRRKASLRCSGRSKPCQEV